MRMVAATLMFCCAANVQAAGDETNGHAYFTKAELPDMTKILPPFPAFESARIVPITEGSAYTLQGTPATASTRGIGIEGSQKVVRK